MTVLLMLQTQRFILTVSPPADLQPLPNKNTLSFYDPIHKNNIACYALSIGKNKIFCRQRYSPAVVIFPFEL